MFIYLKYTRSKVKIRENEDGKTLSFGFYTARKDKHLS